MKLSEFKVGDKVTNTFWHEDAWIEILYKGNDSAFCRTSVGTEDIFYYKTTPPAHWILYTKPKKKVTKWLWASYHGELNPIMSDTPPHDYPMKLEWSATEFEE